MIDDILMAPPVTIDDVVSVNDVEALEIYHGTSAPIDYNGLTTCGVVMIWTRDPVAEGQPFSWGKVLFVVGFGVFAIFGPT